MSLVVSTARAAKLSPNAWQSPFRFVQVHAGVHQITGGLHGFRPANAFEDGGHGVGMARVFSPESASRRPATVRQTRGRGPGRSTCSARWALAVAAISCGSGSVCVRAGAWGGVCFHPANALSATGQPIGNSGRRRPGRQRSRWGRVPHLQTPHQRALGPRACMAWLFRATAGRTAPAQQQRLGLDLVVQLPQRRFAAAAAAPGSGRNGTAIAGS